MWNKEEKGVTENCSTGNKERRCTIICDRTCVQNILIVTLLTDPITQDQARRKSLWQRYVAERIPNDIR